MLGAVTFPGIAFAALMVHRHGRRGNAAGGGGGEFWAMASAPLMR